MVGTQIRTANEIMGSMECHDKRSTRREWLQDTTRGTTGGLLLAGQARAQESREETAIQHRTVETNGIRMHIAECGEGPVVILCHGFPESWYSWRHQLPALARAGFHAVAPDMRGYGQTDAPNAIDQYTLLHLIGDMVGLLNALGAESAVIAGHDWGAPVAWNSALLRPDRFRRVIGLSVPYLPRGGKSKPTSTMPQTEDAIFYQLYFQTPGVAEVDLERNVEQTVRRLLYSVSGDRPRQPGLFTMVPRKTGMVASLLSPAALPAWLTEADVRYYATELSRTGFRGGLNWYRNTDRNWELMAPMTGAKVTVPALYIAGDHDLVVNLVPQGIANLSSTVPQIRRTVMLPGCGHWTQQERPEEVNKALVEFLRS
jgi:pimeloyl-ACP methyl ester carboxylesterase